MDHNSIRVFNASLAAELDEKSAMFIHQLHYWLNRPKIGYTVDGQRFIKNTYAGWTEPENFPFWSVKTVQRVVNKLRDLGILVIEKARNKWDRTLLYCLNYSHELLVKFGYMDRVTRSKESESPDRNGQIDQMNNTDTTTRTTSNTYSVSTTRKPFGCKAIGKEREYKKKEEVVKEWLGKKEKGFRREVQKYVDLHCNKKTTMFPVALAKKIKLEIWKKFTGQDHSTDFEYVDKEQLKELVCITPDPVIVVHENSLEHEMARLYESGGLYG